MKGFEIFSKIWRSFRNGLQNKASSHLNRLCRMLIWRKQAKESLRKYQRRRWESTQRRNKILDFANSLDRELLTHHTFAEVARNRQNSAFSVALKSERTDKQKELLDLLRSGNENQDLEVTVRHLLAPQIEGLGQRFPAEYGRRKDPSHYSDACAGVI